MPAKVYLTFLNDKPDRKFEVLGYNILQKVFLNIHDKIYVVPREFTKTRLVKQRKLAASHQV